MSDQLRKAHQCNQCTKAFSSSHQLAQHVRIHSQEKPYKCSVCDRSFKQLSHVQQHMRLHTGERPYKCSDMNCGRSFIQLSNLQQHMRTHSNGIDKQEREKRHANSSPCQVCGKTYVNEGSLRKHIQNNHTDMMNSQSNNHTQVSFLAQINNGGSINALLNCAADMKKVAQQNNTNQLTNNSANNLFFLNNNHNNVAVISLTPKALKGNTKKR